MEMLHPQMVFHKDYPEKKTLKEIKKKEMCELAVCLAYFFENYVTNNCLCKNLNLFFFKQV